MVVKPFGVLVNYVPTLLFIRECYLGNAYIGGFLLLLLRGAGAPAGQVRTRVDIILFLIGITGDAFASQHDEKHTTKAYFYSGNDYN